MEYGEIPPDPPAGNSGKNAKINCLICKHFVTTWNPKFPRACKVFGFKGKELPSVMVERVTGKQCPVFEPKKK
jgi:hypothetical protein